MSIGAVDRQQDERAQYGQNDVDRVRPQCARAVSRVAGPDTSGRKSVSSHYPLIKRGNGFAASS